MKRIRFILLLLVASAICLPALWPLLNNSFFHLHDFTHVTRLVEMHRALMDGHFPVRWSENLGFGYGMPLFNFYAPLPYYLAEIFYVIGLTPIWAIKAVVIFNFVLSFIALYKLTKPFFGFWGAMIAGTAFVYAPYRSVDFYVRGALGELTAITFVAVALWCLWRWFETRRRHWGLWTALSLSMIITSHNLVALISFPFILVVLGLMIFSIEGSQRLRFAARGMMIVTLGIGLSAFYSVPALLEKDFTRVETLTQEFSNYNHHFLYLRQYFQPNWKYGGSIFGPNDDMSFFLGYPQLVLAGISFLSLIVWRKRTNKKLLISFLATSGFLLAALLMATFKTKIVWDLVPLMAFIQFPWRFLSVAIIFLSFMTGASIWGLKQRNFLAPGIFGVISVILLMVMNVGYFKPEKYLDNPEALYYTDEARIQQQMSGIIPDFMPNIEAKIPLAPPENRLEFSVQPRSETLEVNRVHEFLVSALVDVPTTFTANIFYFPGWSLYVNGKKVEPQVDPYLGTMSIALEPNDQVVYLSGKFEETPVRKIADLITVVSGLIVAGLFLTQRNRIDA